MGKKSKLSQKKAEKIAPIKIEKQAHVSDGYTNSDVPCELNSEQKTQADMDSLSKQPGLNMKVRTKQSQNVNEEDNVTDKDIDEFCDNLDDEANLQFENWVKLLEAKLSGVNKSLVSNKETGEQPCTSRVAMKIEKKNKPKHSKKARTGGSSAAVVITEDSSNKKITDKSVKNELISEDDNGSIDQQSSFGAAHIKRKYKTETELQDPQIQKKKRKQTTK